MKIAKRARLALSAERAAFWRSRPVQVDQVLYESFAGNAVGCNPEAIFRNLLDHPDYLHLQHVWVISDRAAIARFEAEFGAHPRVRHVVRGTNAYIAALSTSGYLVNNATFPPSFGKRPGQVYLNTWHGTPLKHMGFDMPDGAHQSANTLRNLLSADYLLAANPFMAETMYEGAYRLRNIYQGRIVEEGYPRIDRQRLTPAQTQQVRRDLSHRGLATGDRRIVLFAPTWRGASFSRPDRDLDALAAQVDALQQALGDEHIVLLKTHQVVHRHAATRPALARVLVPDAIPANVLLGAADALVTDYSSIFFDYLATGRPIAFLTPDATDYQESRGTYLPLDELPGPVGADPAEVGAALRTLIEDGAKHERYDEWADRFVPFDDGHATERIVDIVFGRHESGYRVRRARTDGRTRLLFHLGGMRANGITTSALNLLSALDPQRYDVTAVMGYAQSPAARANQLRVPAHVRQIFRIGGMNGSKAVQLRRRRNDWRGTPLGPRAAEWHLRLWEDEWTRVLGSGRFDWAADFSGYSPFWANLVLHAPATTHAIWLHNEMVADRNRTVGGRARMHRSLGLVFALYRHYEQLVSVSPSLTELNRVQLAGSAPSVRFRTVRNLPDVERAATGIRLPLSSVLDEGEPRPEWFAELAAGDATWFISVGRLSPEKNHARLIRAFAAVHRQRPDTRLLIVGSGPLEDELRTLIEREGLPDAAFLAGSRSNPYPLLAAADCFVLSSNYEGQPMVLLEAALSDLPIVSTAFASVEDALPPGAIHVVAQDDAALAAGMTAFLDGDVPASHLDAEAYTAAVMAEFAAVAGPR